MSTEAAAVRLVARPWVIATFLGGPLGTVVALQYLYAAGAQWLAAAPLSMWLTVAVVVWSPLPFSLPAVILERERDDALPGYRGLGRVVRAALLVPHMLTRSPARVEFAVSLVGFAVAAIAAWSGAL